LRGFGPIVAVAVFGLMLAPDAGASGHGRRTTGSGTAPQQYLRSRLDPLARLPDSALRMPPDLRMVPFMAGPRDTPASDFAAANSRPVAGLNIRQVSLGGSARQGYKRFCDNLSARVWDNPNGRRLSFDSRGKPGVAVEIPLR